jgi:hypothetical protein
MLEYYTWPKQQLFRKIEMTREKFFSDILVPCSTSILCFPNKASPALQLKAFLEGARQHEDDVCRTTYYPMMIDGKMVLFDLYSFAGRHIFAVGLPDNIVMHYLLDEEI